MNSIRDKRISVINERVCAYTRAKHTCINVKSGPGLFNFRCHENSVQYSILNPSYSVAEVIYIENGTPVLHYINYNENEFLETTLGWTSEFLEYFLIRYIDTTKLKEVPASYNDVLDTWLSQFTNWFDRKILRIDRVL